MANSMLAPCSANLVTFSRRLGNWEVAEVQKSVHHKAKHLCMCEAPQSWHSTAWRWYRIMFKAGLLGQQREEPQVFYSFAAFERVQLGRDARRAIGPCQNTVVPPLSRLFGLPMEQTPGGLVVEHSMRKLQSPVLHAFVSSHSHTKTPRAKQMFLNEAVSSHHCSFF